MNIKLNDRLIVRLARRYFRRPSYKKRRPDASFADFALHAAERIITRLGLGGRKGPFLVAVFADGAAHEGSPFVVADASGLPAKDISGFVQAWKEAMQLASDKLLQGGDFAQATAAAEEAISPSESCPPVKTTSAASPGVCNRVERAVAFTAPVLAEVAKQTFGNYPALQLILGFIDAVGAREDAEEAFQVSQDGAVQALAGGAGVICNKLGAWFRRVLNPQEKQESK
jgi:thiol-disulfide isomerase/thioredoxin